MRIKFIFYLQFKYERSNLAHHSKNFSRKTTELVQLAKQWSLEHAEKLLLLFFQRSYCHNFLRGVMPSYL